MPSPKSVPALLTLALVALAAVAHATTYSESCYVVTSATNYTGHFDWYQGVYPVFDSVHWATGDPIKWAYYQAPSVPPVRAYPRDCGYCLFYVPHFNALSTPTCTLYYYQASHSGSANLLVNTWVPYRDWPPPPSYYDDDFFAIWNSHDTVATDVVHSTDGAWYKVPLTVGACAEIRDTAATYQNGGNYWTGWVYPDSVDGTYTTARGNDGYDNHAPFIRVWYDWQ